MSQWQVLHDLVISSAMASPLTFTGLAGAEDLMIIAQGVTKSVNTNMGVQVSVDNGASYFGTTGDYKAINGSGVAVDSGSFIMSTSTVSTAQYGVVYLPFAGLSGIIKCNSLNTGSDTSGFIRQFVASTLPINAVRLVAFSAGNFTAGRVQVLGRMRGGGKKVWQSVYRNNLSGVVASPINITGLSGAEDFQVHIRSMQRSVSSGVFLRLSDDNGATYKNGATNYVYSNTGSGTTASALTLFSGIGGDYEGYVHLPAAGLNGAIKATQQAYFGSGHAQLLASVTLNPINALSLLLAAAANFGPSGEIEVLARG